MQRLRARISQIPRLEPRPTHAHKGNCGRVAIIAGSRGMSGAAALAGLAALRAGAGLVRVAAPDSAAALVAGYEPGLMTLRLPEDGRGFVALRALDALRELLEWGDVVAAGPGLGTGDAVGEIIASLLASATQPLVLDADALNVLAPRPEWWRLRGERPLVLTPHPGEMARLNSSLPASRSSERSHPVEPSSDEARAALAEHCAAATGAVVVLKGARTVVATEHGTYVNETGNPGMATGGMGDVLTGVIAALIGQRLTPPDAAVLGVHVHGAAADLLAQRFAPAGYTARELCDVLPQAIAQACQAPFGFRQ